MRTLVIDYGMSNLGSIRRAIEECGSEPFVSDDPRDIAAADHIILPGVGAFPDGMHNLHERGWVEAIHSAVANEGIPLLGICLGMQLLADRGYEGRETAGLGLIPGEVILLKPDSPDIRIPHVGWNEIKQVNGCPLLNNISDGTDFYFVHSYHFQTEHQENIVATTAYCGEFVSIVSNKNVFGVQFHPEKSSKMGFELLKNFLSFYKVGG